MKNRLLTVLLCVMLRGVALAQPTEFERLMAQFPELKPGLYDLQHKEHQQLLTQLNIQQIVRLILKPTHEWCESNHYGQTLFHENTPSVHYLAQELSAFFQAYQEHSYNEHQCYSIGSIRGPTCTTLVVNTVAHYLNGNGPVPFVSRCFLISFDSTAKLVDGDAFSFLDGGIDNRIESRLIFLYPDVYRVNCITSGYGTSSIMEDGCVSVAFEYTLKITPEGKFERTSHVFYSTHNSYRDTLTNEVIVFGQCHERLKIIYKANFPPKPALNISEAWGLHSSYLKNPSQWAILTLVSDSLNPHQRMVVQFPNSSTTYTLQFKPDHSSFTSTGSDGSPVQTFTRLPE